MIVLPFLGVLIYLIAHGQDMGKRDIDQVQAQQAQFDEHVRSVAAEDGGAPRSRRPRACSTAGRSRARSTTG